MVVPHDEKLVHYYSEETLKATEYDILDHWTVVKLFLITHRPQKHGSTGVSDFSSSVLSSVVIAQSELCDRDWSKMRHVMCKNKPCCWFRKCSVMFPGNMASRDPCSQGTWCKLRHTMHLRRFLGPTIIYIRRINMYSMLLHHGWWHKFVHLSHDITKQILTVSLYQHWKILPWSCAMLPEGVCLSGNVAQLWSIIFQCCPWHQSIFV